MSPLNEVEWRLYHLLGVEAFRKVVLWIERAKHYKDKGRNVNYHLSGFDVISLEKFNGFFLYNTFLHCVSLIFCVIYLILAVAFGIHNRMMDMFMVLLSIVNVYCIMLQRANYLKMKKHCYNYYQRFYAKVSLCKEELLKIICIGKPQEIQADYALICRLREAYLGKCDCILGASDIESMKRLYRCTGTFIPQTKMLKKRMLPEEGLLEKCSTVAGPYSALQKRVDWLQGIFGVTRRKMLGQTSVVTENASCEKLYKQLFPGDTVEGLVFVCCVLYEVYSGIVVEMKIDGV